MNRYKVTYLEYGICRTIIVSAYDMSNAVTLTGCSDTRSVIKAELVEASEVEDRS